MTDPWYGKPMPTNGVNDFLDEQGTGVLCLVSGRRAYGIPVAFAYDSENERAVLDLGFAPESKKREFIAETDEACLTTDEWSGPHDWKSVVMSGRLEELADEDPNEEIEAWFYTVAKDIDVEEAGLELQWYELDANELSGRYYR